LSLLTVFGCSSSAEISTSAGKFRLADAKRELCKLCPNRSEYLTLSLQSTVASQFLPDSDDVFVIDSKGTQYPRVHPAGQALTVKMARGKLDVFEVWFDVPTDVHDLSLKWGNSAPVKLPGKF